MPHDLSAATSPRPEALLPLAAVREPGPRHERHRILAAIAATYLLAAAATVPVAELAPMHGWIALHLLLLGAATNAIFVFSRHFAQALLHTRGTSERWAAGRLVVLNTGVVSVLVGVSWSQTVLLAVGGSLVVAAVLGHVASLVRMDRSALLAGRLRVVVWFYIVAGLALAVGGVVGGLLGGGTATTAASHAALRLAHVHLNLLGWVGLTVVGTSFMLWPAVLRTRMAKDAAAVARRVLVLVTVGVAVTATGFLAQLPAVAVAGLVTYAAAVGYSLVPAVRIARHKPPRSAAAVMLAAAVGWLLVALVIDIAAAVRGLDAAADVLDDLVPLLALGFVAQVLIAALSFLVPVTIGGGPVGNRRLTAVLETGWTGRAFLANAGVLLFVLPLPAPANAFGTAAAVVGLGSFVPLLISALVPSRGGSSGDQAKEPAGHSFLSTVSVLTTVAVLGLVATGAWPQRQPSSAASRSGAVQIELGDMVVRPSVIAVVAGEPFVLEVRNGGRMRHDLRLEDGRNTPMLAPGESAVLELGPVTEDMLAWCSVPGHRQAGMTLQIQVTDDPAF